MIVMVNFQRDNLTRKNNTEQPETNTEVKFEFGCIFPVKDEKWHHCSDKKLGEKQGNKYTKRVTAHFLADPEAKQVNKELYNLNLVYTIHGVWPVDLCTYMGNEALTVSEYFGKDQTHSLRQ